MAVSNTMLLPSFHEFTTICGSALITNSLFLCYLYTMSDENANKKKYLILLAKMVNVGLTVVAFMTILISDHGFDVADDMAELFGVDAVTKNFDWAAWNKK